MYLLYLDDSGSVANRNGNHLVLGGVLVVERQVHWLSQELEKLVRNLAEVPLFADSRACRLLQLADHIAYAVFRRYESGDTSYLDPILSRFVAQEGKLHGLVHRQMVDMSCMCPACMSRR